MKNCFIYSIFIANFMYGYAGVKYLIQTQVEYVDEYESKGPSSFSPWNSAFPNVEEKERNEMCARAEELHFHRRVEVTSSKVEPKLYTLSEKYEYVMKCRTVPTLYLYRQGTNAEGEMMIVMVMEKNEFKGFGSPNFYTQTVHVDPPSCREAFIKDRKYIDTDPREVAGLVQYVCDEDRVLQASYLWKFSETRRYHLCVAAAERCNVEGVHPVMQTNYVDEAQIFEIRNPIFEDLEPEKRVALRCPTSPRLHVYFREILKGRDVEVLVTEKQEDTIKL